MSEEEFPWHLGIYDAHCHPTDINASIQRIPQMKARTLTLMATREEDQELVHKAANELGPSSSRDINDSAVRVIPAYGWHPWFSHLLFDDNEFPGRTKLNDEEKRQHYSAVLSPPPEDDSFINAPEEPFSLSTLIAQHRSYLDKHPLALIGEIGIDKAFRIPEPWKQEDLNTRIMERTGGSREGRKLASQKVPMEHQRKVLEAQLKLAGEKQRAVSVHGVQAHGILFDIFKGLWKGHEKIGKRARKKVQDAAGTFDDDAVKNDAKPFPPRICLHSYSGAVENLKQYFAPSVPADVYVSFSIAINFSTAPATTRVEEVIKWVPKDRILIESDLHQAGQDMDDMLEQIARKVCNLRGWKLEEGVTILGDNYKRFISGPVAGIL